VKGTLVPLSSVAANAGVRHRTMKRRLKNYDARIGGGLLVRFCETGTLYVDLDTLRRVLPALARDPNAPDPATQTALALEELREDLRVVASDVAAVRDRVGA
jgi:hypothetical protein